MPQVAFRKKRRIVPPPDEIMIPWTQKPVHMTRFRGITLIFTLQYKCLFLEQTRGRFGRRPPVPATTPVRTGAVRERRRSSPTGAYRERSGVVAAGIDAGHEAIPALPPSLQDGRDPRQALVAEAARHHPDLAQPGALPAPGSREPPLAPQVPVQIDLVVANAQSRRFLPAQVDAFVQMAMPCSRCHVATICLQCFEGCTLLFS